MVLVACIGVGAVLAYTVGGRDAKADAYACYRYGEPELGCVGCVDQNCPFCDDGVCPGKNKVCTYKQEITVVINESGKLNRTPILRPCFIRWRCIPDGGQAHCSLQYPCVKGSVGFGSQTTFVDEVLYDDCPPP